ncbi:hypothetical protein THAOC_20797 [Thalassiosira oceanica]|uniref:Uncharacterized protein n=1 Tax=Thalassiosira oceanica TaxID=159749 RepID=K0S158_THAOC|nr:hypothetical protein THAOC_20797 [Thalassiosira oceanica]|eukprot:EJK59035.1 hypothetical protein THAOC_20797 [Thalassiosira oceanica]
MNICLLLAAPFDNSCACHSNCTKSVKYQEIPSSNLGRDFLSRWPNGKAPDYGYFFLKMSKGQQLNQNCPSHAFFCKVLSHLTVA